MPDLESLAQAVIELDETKVATLVEHLIGEKIAPETIINKGLIPGIEKVGILFKRGEFFLPEVMAATTALKKGLSLVEPLMGKDNGQNRRMVMLGTVKGDIHDIGRRLVGMMLETVGFRVVDLGNDVSEEMFVEKTKELKPRLIGMSALLNTTMLFMKTTVDALKEAGLRDGVKVIVGGSPVTPAFAERIGADGTAADAIRAVELAKSLLKE